LAKRLIIGLLLAPIGIAAWTSAVRLGERAAFRSAVAPLVRSDLVDLDDFLTDQDADYLSTLQQVRRRERRIRKLRAVDAGPYREARATIADLMEKENGY
jgi:hypothetical protein